MTFDTSNNVVGRTTPAIISVYGRNGQNGQNGQNGRGITSITEYYARSQDLVQPADASFSTSVPTIDIVNRYLWNYEIITYTDNTTHSSAKKIIGVYGATGDPGTPGVSITNVEAEYAQNKNPEEVPASGWSTACPEWTYGSYLWIRSKITYSDGSIGYTEPYSETSWKIIDDISVGSENLLIETTNVDTTTSSAVGELILPTDKNGDTYITSVNMKDMPSQWVSFRVHLTNTNYKAVIRATYAAETSALLGTYTLKQGVLGVTSGQVVEYVAETDGDGWSTVVVKLPNANISVQAVIKKVSGSNAKITYHSPKLELGAFPTQWSPSPKDIQNTLDALSDLAESLETQIDSKIQTWRQSTVPSWDNADRDKHIGDLWYCTANVNTYTNGMTYRYEKNGSTYSWQKYSISDTLFDKVDGKTTVFYGSPDTSFTDPAPEDGDYLVNNADGSTYQRANGSWEPLTQSGGGENLIHGTTDDSTTITATTLLGYVDNTTAATKWLTTRLHVTAITGTWSVQYQTKYTDNNSVAHTYTKQITANGWITFPYYITENREYQIEV